jgi:hypothetical protein
MSDKLRERLINYFAHINDPGASVKYTFEHADAILSLLTTHGESGEEPESAPEGWGGPLLDDRPFPIQDGPTVPWYVMAPHEAQCQKNHSQSLKRIAERGGFGACEAYAVTHGLTWQDMKNDIEKYTKAWFEFAERVNKEHHDLRKSDDAGRLREACQALLDYESAMDGADGCGENEDMYWKAVKLAREAIEHNPVAEKGE